MTTVPVRGLLMEGEWTPPIDVLTEHSSSLTRIIVDAKGHLFPGNYLCRFDLPLARPNDLQEAIRADLALVANGFDAWYLLFVVPARTVDMDSLVSKLESARLVDLGDRAARYLAREIDELDEGEARLLVREVPGLVVVTDDPAHQWYETFTAARLKVEVIVVEPFPIQDDGYTIRLNGQVTSNGDVCVIATCEEHPTFSTCLLVTWVDSTAKPAPGNISLTYRDIVTLWELRPGEPIWQLHAVGSFPILESPPFEIVERADGTLSIRKQEN